MANFGFIDDALPLEAVNQGWSLMWEYIVIDPVYLIDRKGAELYRWDYIPSLTELFEVCASLERR